MKRLFITTLTAAALAAPLAYAAPSGDYSGDPSQIFAEDAATMSGGREVFIERSDQFDHSGDSSKGLFAEGAPGATREYSGDLAVSATPSAPKLPGYLFVRADMNNDGWLDAAEMEEAERLIRLEEIES